MKKYHPSQQSTPKRSRAKKRRVQYQPPREETPFSRTSKLNGVKRKRRLIDTVYLVITVIAGTALLSYCHSSFATYLTTRSQLKRHDAQLAQLKTREASLQQRLAQLKSPDGRDQLLRERGFVQGNERILLFADDAQPSDDASTVTLAPVNQKSASAPSASFWGGIAQAIDHAADRPAVR
jgi:cell division protein FtsB